VVLWTIHLFDVDDDYDDDDAVGWKVDCLYKKNNSRSVSRVSLQSKLIGCCDITDRNGLFSLSSQRMIIMFSSGGHQFQNLTGI